MVVTMPYAIKQLEEEQCVAVTYDASAEFEETAAARKGVVAMLAANRWKRVLVDVTAMQSIPKAADLFDLGTSMPKTLPRSARVALVARADQARHARLLETVVRSHGALLTWFSDPQRARAWLAGDKVRPGKH